MKKIAILTINDDTNFGNRLQNYALQEILNKKNLIVKTIDNKNIKKTKNLLKQFIFFNKGILRRFSPLKRHRRWRKFVEFNKNFIYSNEIIYLDTIPSDILEYNDYFIVGSDQVWNPTITRLSTIDVLKDVVPNKRISYAASFGIDRLPKKNEEIVKQEISKFKSISVRENEGKKIIEDLTGRKDVEVLIDPTMLLTSKEWDKISKKPKMIKNKNYILNYFLGDLSEQRQKEIERIAKENECEIISILDKNSIFYECGPREFLYLEKNAFLICTDSFHSSVFAILYNRPFIIFDREDEKVKMNSRIDTLLSKFNIKNRRYDGKITDKNLKHDYSDAYKILEQERKKSEAFLEKALDL